LRTLDDLDVRDRVALVRADFNVPLSEGAVADDTRIRATLPTIAALRRRGARKVVLTSHLGRPKGYDPRLSLLPIAERLSELLELRVPLLPIALEEAEEAAAAADDGSVLLLENTRFYPGEERNDPDLARRLAGLADVFVQDAFGAVHRAHASTVAVARLLPAAAGLLLEREVTALGGLLNNPARPFVALLGGAKVSDKIGVLDSLLPRVDRLLIGGAMANTFLLARGYDMGRSLVEPDSVAAARALLDGRHADKLVLPADLVAAEALDRPEAARTARPGETGDGAAFDIGPDTAERFAAEIRRAATVFWNGPMGVFETERFARGTYAAARAVAECGGWTVVGGGDSVAALERSGYADRVGHISTGGGASLEVLEGKPLPGIAVLEEGHA
jgi:phosphoglycerate kinase